MNFESLKEHPYVLGGGLLVLLALFYFLFSKKSASGQQSVATGSAAIAAANQQLTNLENSTALQQSMAQTNALGALYGNVLNARMNANTLNTQTALGMASSNTQAILSDISARQSAIIAEQQALAGA